MNGPTTGGDRSVDGETTSGYPPAPADIAAAIRAYWPWRFLGLVLVVLVITTIAALADAVVIGGIVAGAVILGSAYVLAPWR